MSLEKTKQWFEQAIPEPTIEQACVQIGCALEETGELLHTLCDMSASDEVSFLSKDYKSGALDQTDFLAEMSKEERVQMLDDIVDEIVTRIGIGHCMKMDVLGALEEVNRSNFSKLEGGKAVFDENGKITKGKDYVKPNLEKFV